MAETQGQLGEFAAVLKRRKWQICLPALFVLSIGIAFAVIVPKKYLVETMVEIKESRVETDYQLKDPQATSTMRELQNAEQHIRHFKRIEEIMGDQGELWSDVYQKLDERGRHEFITAVMANISVLVVDKRKDLGSTFVNVQYTDVNPFRAEQFLRRLTQVWIEKVIERDRNILREERDVLQNLVKASDETFRSLQQRFIDLAKKMNIDPTIPLHAEDRQVDVFYREFETVTFDVERVETALARERAELENLRSTRALEPDQIAEVVTEGAVNFSEEIEFLELEILTLRQGQEGLTPLNSVYRQIESEIGDKERQIEESKALEREGEERTVSVPNPRIFELEREIDDKEHIASGLAANLESLEQRREEKQALSQARTDDYSDLMELAAQKARTERDLFQRTAELAEKKAALALMVDAWDQPFEIVMEPRAPSEPTEPNPMLIVIFAAMAGIALGLVIAIASEYAKNSYRNVNELSQVMTVPVLGSINAIVTRLESRRSRIRRFSVGFSSAAVLGGIGWAIWLWSFSPETLPVEVVEAIRDLQLKLM